MTRWSPARDMSMGAWQALYCTDYILFYLHLTEEALSCAA